MTKEEIKRKLINDPEWEPSNLDIKKDPDVWTKIDAVMEDMHGAPLTLLDEEEIKPKKKKNDDFEDIFGSLDSTESDISAGDLNFTEVDLYNQ